MAYNIICVETPVISTQQGKNSGKPVGSDQSMNVFNRTRGLQRHAATFGKRQMSGQPFGSLPTALYNGVWRKSNIMYITYVVVGCVAIEVVYGAVTNKIWESANSGVSVSDLFSLAPQLSVQVFILFLRPHIRL